MATDSVDFVEALREQGSHAYQTTLRQQAGERLMDAWDVGLTAPEDNLAYMLTLPIPFETEATFEAAQEIHDRLFREHGVEVPVMPLGGQVWLRVSAQVYVDLDDVERLAQAFGPKGWVRTSG